MITVVLQIGKTLSWPIYSSISIKMHIPLSIIFHVDDIGIIFYYRFSSLALTMIDLDFVFNLTGFLQMRQHIYCALTYFPILMFIYICGFHYS